MAVSFADRFFARVVRREPLFWGGWGDLDYVNRVREGKIRFQSAAAASVHYTRAQVEPSALSERTRAFLGPLRVTHGRFLSPETRLQGKVRRAAVLRVAPPAGVPSKGAFVALAGAGEERFAVRRMLWRPLIEEGYTALFLENPFYGTRRCTRQRTVAVETIENHLTLTSAVVSETCALLGHLENQGFSKLGVAGFSMGGFHTALVAAVFRKPLAIAVLAGGACPKDVFTESLFARSVPFAALAQDGDDEQTTRARVADTFGISVESYDKPVTPNAFRCVGLLRDGFVPVTETDRLAAWAGSPAPIWIDAGHTDGLVRARHALRTALREAFEALPSTSCA